MIIVANSIHDVETKIGSSLDKSEIIVIDCTVQRFIKTDEYTITVRAVDLFVEEVIHIHFEEISRDLRDTVCTWFKANAHNSKNAIYLINKD